MSPPSPAPAPVPSAEDSADVAHFKAIPWCATRLAEPGVIARPAISRHPKPGASHDSFISKTVNSPSTIAAFITFERPRRPAPTSAAGAGIASGTATAPSSAAQDEIGAFLTLGRDLDGYAGICHGGVVAAVFDEVVGLIASVNGQRTLHAGTWMTARLTTDYRRPVRTPGTYVIMSRVTDRKGRKCTVRARLEDEAGTVLAESEALLVALRPKM